MSGLCCFCLLSPPEFYWISLIYCVLDIFLVLTMLYLFVKRLRILLLQQRSDAISIELSATKSSAMPSMASVSSETAQSINMSTTPKPGGEDVDGDNGATPTTPSAPSTLKKLKSLNSMANIRAVQSTLTKKQSKWIFLITRCILLSGIALITSTAFSLFVFYFVNQGQKMDIFSFYILWTVDMLTNSVCLYLNFTFADKAYKKMCRVCHGGCQGIVEWCTAINILRDHAKELAAHQNDHHLTTQ